MAPNQPKLAAYCQANEQATRQVLKDVVRYGGEGALVVRFARLVLSRSHGAGGRA